MKSFKNYFWRQPPQEQEKGSSVNEDDGAAPFPKRNSNASSGKKNQSPEPPGNEKSQSSSSSKGKNNTNHKIPMQAASSGVTVKAMDTDSRKRSVDEITAPGKEPADSSMEVELTALGSVAGSHAVSLTVASALTQSVQGSASAGALAPGTGTKEPDSSLDSKPSAGPSPSYASIAGALVASSTTDEILEEHEVKEEELNGIALAKRYQPAT